MKKIILFSFLLISSSFGIDSSVVTEKSKDIKLGKSIEVKKSSDKKKSTTSKKSNDTKSDVSTDLTFDTFPIYFPALQECSKSRKNIADFGINFSTRNGSIDLNKKNYYESIAANGENVRAASFNDTEFRKFLACLIIDGAKMAQANLNLNEKLKVKKNFTKDDFLKMAQANFSALDRITSSQIEKTINVVAKDLQNESCNFFHSLQIIQCGSVVYDFSKNEVVLGNETLFGYGTIYGINTSFKVAVSNSSSSAIEKSDETSNSNSQNASMNKSKTLDQSIKTNDNTSLGKVMPSVQ